MRTFGGTRTPVSRDRQWEVPAGYSRGLTELQSRSRYLTFSSQPLSAGVFMVDEIQPTPPLLDCLGARRHRRSVGLFIG